MTDQDELMMADFGRTDSVFWRKRLAKTGFKPTAKAPQAEAPAEGYYKGEDGKTYYSDGKKLSEVN